MSLVHAVTVPRRPVSRLEPVIGAQRYEQLTRAADQARPVLGGRTIWNVNSTAAGGGVAEMLQVLVGYVQDLGMAIGWLVITGDAGFFAITSRASPHPDKACLFQVDAGKRAPVRARR